MIIAVDGDTVAYRAAFASQHSVYTLFHLGTPLKEFRYKKDLVEAMPKYTPEEEYSWEKEERLAPLAHCLQNCKSILGDLQNKCKDKFGDIEIVVYLSGPDNFRKKIANKIFYKGQRSEAKPKHLPALREYLAEHWGATWEEQLEADDLMSMLSYRQGFENVVLATTDKDLNQVPGWHYDFTKKEFAYWGEGASYRFFWTQMLEGDTADNIPGIEKVGKVRAAKMLDECEDYDDYPQVVFSGYVDKYGDDDGAELFKETYSLLRLLRTDDEYQKLREAL